MSAQLENNTGNAPPISPAEMQAALERVLHSKRFVNAPMKQRFLRLICEFQITGRGAELNEYLIGKEVFDRGDNYSPATDPIVRVSAHSVREKLSLYNRQEGANEEIQIEIPIGSYEPTFFRVNNQVSPANEALHLPVSEPANPTEATVSTDTEFPTQHLTEETPVPFMPSWHWKTAYAVIGLLSLLAIYLLWENYRLMAKSDDATSSIKQARNTGGLAWKPFFQNSEATLLILSNPVVHRLANEADPDTLIQKGILLSKEQVKALDEATGNRLPKHKSKEQRLVPALSMYTGIGEAIGAYRIAELLHHADEATVLKQSRSVSPDDLKNYDVIILGSVYSNQWSKPLSLKENFIYSDHSTIENLSPQTGELREYKALFDQQSGRLLEDYALITVIPSVAENRTIMVLAGIFSEGTEAAAEFVTDPTHLAELNQQLGKLKLQSHGTAYYQALLHVQVENSFPTKISLVTVRELRP